MISSIDLCRLMNQSDHALGYKSVLQYLCGMGDAHTRWREDVTFSKHILALSRAINDGGRLRPDGSIDTGPIHGRLSEELYHVQR